MQTPTSNNTNTFNTIGRITPSRSRVHVPQFDFGTVAAAAGAQLSAHIAQQERPLKLSPPQSFYDYQQDLRKQKLQQHPKPSYAKGKGRGLTIPSYSSTTSVSSTSSSSYITLKEPSPDPTHRHPMDILRPSNWKGTEHSKALLMVWTNLGTEVEKSLRIYKSVAVVGDATLISPSGLDVGDLGQRLDLVEYRMRTVFPALGQGSVRLGRDWLEYVLAGEGVEPFSTIEFRDK